MNGFTRYGKTITFLVLVLFLVSIASSVPVGHAAAQTTVYDFVQRASEATWQSGAGGLPFPGKETDSNGFALLRSNAQLEDGSTPPLVLETHPQWVGGGWIAGTYPQFSVGSGSELFLRVGFLSGAQGSDGVTFSVRILELGAQTKSLVDLPAAYDGKLSETLVSLASYAGKTVSIQLVVNAGNSAGQDWAVWADARIRQQVLDTDQDGIPDTQDNCPQVTNPNQGDVDGDRLGDACDTCDDRDPDGDGIKTCQDQCPSQPETVNAYLDGDGCPDTLPVTETATEPPTTGITGDWFTGILEGPMMPGAFEDADQDGVYNYRDDCPETPAAQREAVFENGCLCTDSDGGFRDEPLVTVGTVVARYAGGESSCTDHCDGEYLMECSCNPAFERGRASSENAILQTRTNCARMGTLPEGFTWSCANSRCIASAPAIPNLCFSREGTCADGIQNQGEQGVDCGGICPPCNTTCTTGTRYAPPDTPCTSIYPTDLHQIELYWTDSWLEFPCRLYEICHPDLDHVIEEATRCCSIRNFREGMTAEEMRLAEQSEIDAMPDPNLCSAARELTGGGGGCSRCVGLYIIKGLGEYARWMEGYNWLYPAYDVEGIGANPAERLINDYRTGVCRDYGEATATLLRKAGYPQTSVNNFCDGAHCYDVVKIPGERYWHVVDTTGNATGIIFGSLPGRWYPYCTNLDEANYCFDGSRPGGEACTGTELEMVDIPTLCRPGVACGRDAWLTPGQAPVLDEIVGCR